MSVNEEFFIVYFSVKYLFLFGIKWCYYCEIGYICYVSYLIRGLKAMRSGPVSCLVVLVPLRSLEEGLYHNNLLSFFSKQTLKFDTSELLKEYPVVFKQYRLNSTRNECLPY